MLESCFLLPIPFVCVYVLKVQRGLTIEKDIPVLAGAAGAAGAAPPASAALDTPMRREFFFEKMLVRVISVSMTLMLIIGFWPERDERSLVGLEYLVATCMKPMVENANTAAIQTLFHWFCGTRFVMMTNVRYSV